MPSGKSVTGEKMDSIQCLLEKGLTAAEAASITGVSEMTAKRVSAAYSAVKSGDIESINRQPSNYLEWACAKLGVNLKDVNKDKPAEEPKPETRPDNTAQALVALLNCINDLTAAIERIDNRLSAMQMTQQGFRGDVTEAAKKLVESIHVEGDILTKEHERMIDILGGIKMNTKKRQYQEDR